MDQSFKNLVERGKSVLVMLPVSPSFDVVAAGLSLYLALKDKKSTSVACASDMLVEFNRLVGVDRITKELGTKNLVISLVNYNPDNLEKVSYDLEESGEMKLNIITKPEGTPPTPDQVKLNYTGVNADLIILVGGTDETSFPDLAKSDFADKRFAHVGVSEVKIAGKDIISFARPASSISEIVGALVKESAYEVDADLATNLVMGIEEGSEHFTNVLTSADTFAMVAELMKLGGKRSKQTIEVTPVSTMPGQVPPNWMDPKIYKGTSVS